MLHGLRDFIPLLCVFAFAYLAVRLLDRVRPAWLLRGRRWHKKLSEESAALGAAVIGGSGILFIAAVVFGLRIFHLTPSGMYDSWGAVGTALAVAIVGGLLTPLLSKWSDPYEEPEDWLLWDLEDEKKT